MGSLRPARLFRHDRTRRVQSEYLTTMRARRAFSWLQLAKAWHTCLASYSGRSEYFSAKRAWAISCPGFTRASAQGCLSSARM